MKTGLGNFLQVSQPRNGYSKVKLAAILFADPFKTESQTLWSIVSVRTDL